MRIVPLFLSGLAASILLSASAAAEGGPAVEATREIVSREMAARKIPGLQIAVVKNGAIVMEEAFGLANVEHRVAATVDTLFPINSATKSFTGVAVMQLVAEGKAKLDAPISAYVDDLPEAWRGIRVRQLLAHVSGLPNIIGPDGLIGTGGPEEAWALVKTRPIEAAPGERFAYNQTNYLLLSMMIERLRNSPFTDVIRDRQFRPAGMKRVAFGDTFDVIENSAGPYSYLRRVRGGGEIEGAALSRWVDDMPPILRAAGGINATAGDIARWIVALESGALLPKRRLAEMWSADALNDGRAGFYAKGWPIVGDGAHAAVTGIGGGRSAFFIYPRDGVAVVVLTNLVGGSPEQFIGDIAANFAPKLRPTKSETAR